MYTLKFGLWWLTYSDFMTLGNHYNWYCHHLVPFPVLPLQSLIYQHINVYWEAHPSKCVTKHWGFLCTNLDVSQVCCLNGRVLNIFCRKLVFDNDYKIKPRVIRYYVHCNKLFENLVSLECELYIIQHLNMGLKFLFT
jgi:hypothetical protein